MARLVFRGLDAFKSVGKQPSREIFFKACNAELEMGSKNIMFWGGGELVASLSRRGNLACLTRQDLPTRTETLIH